MGLLEIAASTLSGAEQRIEIAARNVANASTPGYKREIAFNQVAFETGASDALGDPLPVVRSTRLMDQGTLIESGQPLDLAINGNAVLLVRQGDRLVSARGGSFGLTADGTLADGQGRILQQAGGGDLVLDPGQPTILGDGTLLIDGTPAGAIGLYDPATIPSAGQAGVLSPNSVGRLQENTTSELRQGMLEQSNVTLSDEMVGLMQTQRMGESAAQIVRTYDQLLSQATETFGRSAK